MDRIYVAEYRRKGETGWLSMFLINPPTPGALWVSDSREMVEGTIEIYGFRSNDYRIVEYERKAD